jgi:predicted RNA-binding protein (virulence factor B family)
MKVYSMLSTNSPYQKDDMVEGIVYDTSEEFGVFVAVDNQYSALIPKKEAYGTWKVGQTLKARVTAVKPDGKLDLSVREKIPMQMDRDAELIWKRLLEYKGTLPFNDKADPDLINREFGLSKNAFKRAVGRLLKEGKIVIDNQSIKVK